MNKVLSVPQVAQHLNLSLWTVYRWARSGWLPSFRLGKRRMFIEKDLQKFLREERIRVTKTNRFCPPFRKRKLRKT
ncbi:MAG: helix-turn-helix domain-containing protein [Nitrospirales bacterium]